MNRVKTFFRWVIAVFFAVALVVFAFYFSEKFASQSDFGHFWADYQLLKSGQNPYDLKLYSKTQALILDPDRVTSALWYPPWFFLILGPVLIWPFKTAVALWLLIGLGISVIAGCLALRYFGYEAKIRPYPILLGLATVPFYVCLKFGTLAPILILSFIGFFVMLRRDKYFLAGLFLTLTFIKPHLFYLIYLMLGIWMIQNRKWKIILPVVFWVAAIAGAAHVLYPHIYGQWLSVYSDPPFCWLTSTLSMFVRLYMPGHPVWPILAVSSVSAIACLWFYLCREKSFSWEKTLPGLLCWSLVTAPYGWNSDQSLLVITQFACIALMMQPHVTDLRRRSVLLLMVGYQLIFSWLEIGPFNDCIWMLFWYPVGQWLVWRWTNRIVASREA